MAGKLLLFFIPDFSRRVTNTARIMLSSDYRLDPARSMDNIAINMAEVIYFLKARRRARIAEYVTIANESYLHSAVSRGCGVLGLSAHLGNFFLMGTRLEQEGYHFTYIVRQPSQPWLSKLIRYAMSCYDLDYVYVGRDNLFLKNILQRLKQGRIVTFIVDEDKGKGGADVEFFGRTVKTAAGPAVIAKRTGCPIIPMFCVRNGRAYTIHIEDELAIGETAGNHVTAHVAAYTKVIESYIRRYPEQWMWHNTRFRDR
jgi:KDO2-lipid IV(A) lauroyltransferase